MMALSILDHWQVVSVRAAEDDGYTYLGSCAQCCLSTNAVM